MKIWKHLSNSIVNVLGLVDELTGEQGLRKSTRQTMSIINESLEQSLVMNRVEAKQELADFLIEHNVCIDDNGNITEINSKTTKKA